MKWVEGSKGSGKGVTRTLGPGIPPLLPGCKFLRGLLVRG